MREVIADPDDVVNEQNEYNNIVREVLRIYQRSHGGLTGSGPFATSVDRGGLVPACSDESITPPPDE